MKQSKSNAAMRPVKSVSKRPDTHIAMYKPNLTGAIAGSVLLLILAGCASRPEPADPNYASLLFKEEGVFLQVKPSENLVLANKMLSAVGMDPESLSTVLERTNQAYCSFEFNDPELQYSIIGQGRYPETIAALSLRNNEEWEKRTSESSKGDTLHWWNNRLSGVKISFIQDNAVCITNGDMEKQLERIFYGPVKPLPDKALQILETGVLGIYSNAPNFDDQIGTAGGMSRLFSHIDEIIMSFSPREQHDNLFSIDAEYLCTNRTVAKSMFLMMKLGLISGIRSLDSEYDYAELMSDDPVTLEEDRVVVKGYPISLEDIDWFFKKALPYVQIEAE